MKDKDRLPIGLDDILYALKTPTIAIGDRPKGKPYFRLDAEGIDLQPGKILRGKITTEQQI